MKSKLSLCTSMLILVTAQTLIGEGVFASETEVVSGECDSISSTSNQGIKHIAETERDTPCQKAGKISSMALTAQIGSTLSYMIAFGQIRKQSDINFKTSPSLKSYIANVYRSVGGVFKLWPSTYVFLVSGIALGCVYKYCLFLLAKEGYVIMCESNKSVQYQ